VGALAEARLDKAAMLAMIEGKRLMGE